MHRYLLICLMLAFIETLGFSQSDFAKLRQDTERDVCNEIKSETKASDGSCYISSWTDTSYSANFSLTGKNVQKSIISTSTGPGKMQFFNRWIWDISVTGSVNCNLNIDQNNWTCETSINPFSAIGTKQSCSCQTAGFSGCSATTQCGSTEDAGSKDGFELVKSSAVNNRIKIYTDANLFH